MYRMCNGNDIWNQQLQEVKLDLKTAILAGKFPDRKVYLPHIPSQLQKVINKCIMFNPDERYNNVLEIINALSVINQNLTWKYKKNINEESWSRISEKGTHEDIIILKKEKNNYKITGQKINIESKKSSNVSKWTYNDTNKEKAIKKIRAFLKE